MILKQQRFFDNRHYELTTKTIKVKFKNMNNEIEIEYRLEQLGRDVIRFTSKSFSLFSGVLFIVCLILGKWLFKDFEPKNQIEIIMAFTSAIIICLIFIFLFIDNRKKEIGIIGGEKELTFFANIPNSEVVDNFVNEILNRRKKIIIYKGLCLENNSISDNFRIDYLNELLDEGYINQIEYEEYKIRVLNDSKKIGF